MAVALRNTIRETRGEDEALERHEVYESCSAYGETAVVGVDTVKLKQRVTVVVILELGSSIVLAVGSNENVRRILLILSHHVSGEISSAIPINGSQRVEQESGASIEP